MLKALDADEQAALLAHEEAHLRHHHQAYLQLTRLAVAGNPLLRPLLALVHTGTERWSDEVAAHAIGNREVTARAVGRAALASHRHGQPSPAAVSAIAGSASQSQLAFPHQLAAESSTEHGATTGCRILLILSLCSITAGMTAMAGHKQVEHIEMTVLDVSR